MKRRAAMAGAADLDVATGSYAGSRMPKTYRKWIFAQPLDNGVLGLEQFALRELPMPEPAAGQALARIKLINIHSNTRMRMARGATRIGETDPTNYACAEILKSRDPAFREGDVIACQVGWQDHQLISSGDGPTGGYGAPSALVKALNGTNSPWCYVFRPAMVKMWPPEVLMEMFGTSGMTAYFGLRECGPLMPRDAVAVAGATGSVGTIAAQLARIAGCRVVGFAGGEDRCAWVREALGIQDCLDYRASDLAKRLTAAFPDGIDVFSDGIGGALTELVVGAMNRHGRLLSFGAAAAFYAPTWADPAAAQASMRRIFGISEQVDAILKARNIKSEVWTVNDFYHERLKAEDDLSRHLLSGALKPISTVVDGFENLPAAIAGLYAAPRAGKLQVRLEPAAAD
jgi:hypothetical protein